MKALPRSTAKDVFSHLLAIVTLYVSVISFITLCFQYVNVKFPDALEFYYTGSLDTIRQSMAALIVVWPVYMLMSWLINTDMKADPEKREIGIRKWLLYLTLFVTAITIIVDLVTLVNYFLNGEITTRFLLKVGVVLVTAAAVFWYYLWDLRRDTHRKTTVPKTTAIVASLVAVGIIALGFVFVGTPAQQRLVRFDDQRVNDLSMLQSEIVNAYATKRALPATLKELNNSLTGFTAPTDPLTGQAYEYAVKGKLTFELCATFATVSVSDDAKTGIPVPARPYGYYDAYSQNWTHQAARTCFERTIDPANYPVPAPVK